MANRASGVDVATRVVADDDAFASEAATVANDDDEDSVLWTSMLRMAFSTNRVSNHDAREMVQDRRRNQE